jgi:hypothetical protein
MNGGKRLNSVNGSSVPLGDKPSEQQALAQPTATLPGHLGIPSRTFETLALLQSCSTTPSLHMAFSMPGHTKLQDPSCLPEELAAGVGVVSVLELRCYEHGEGEGLEWFHGLRCYHFARLG